MHVYSSIILIQEIVLIIRTVLIGLIVKVEMAELNERHGSLVQQFQPGRIVNQISIDRFSGSYEQPIMNTALSNSSLGNSGFHNPVVQNPHGGFNSLRGGTGVRSSSHNESDIRTKMKLCRDGQQCVVNGCSFSHIRVPFKSKFPANLKIFWKTSWLNLYR